MHDDVGPAPGILNRTMAVLRCFTEDEPTLTATRLTEETGFASSSLHRLLAQLVEHGLLTRAPGHRYAVGPRLWELGELSPLSLRLREAALPHMARLYEATAENVHLAVLDAPSPETAVALFVGRLSGHTSHPTLSRVGGRQPLHTTGVGKALLSTCGEDWLRRFFTVPLERETTHSVTDEQELRDDLTLARTRGFATTQQEMTLGNVSVAAPLGPIEGLPRAAIGVVAGMEHADIRRLGLLVIQASADITRTLRDR